MAWKGPLKTLDQITGPDSPGAAPFVPPGPGAPWLNGGNANDNAGSLGTTDDFPLSILTNNIQRAEFAATGELAVGPTPPTPGHILEVQGSGTQAISLTAGAGNSQWAIGADGTLALGANQTDHTTQLGSQTGESLTSIQAGTSGVNVVTPGTVFLRGASGTWSANDGGTLALGANPTDHTTSLGSSTGASPTQIAGGTEGVSITSQGPSNWTVGAGGQLDLGANATEHSTTLGSTTGASETTIQAGTGLIALLGGVLLGNPIDIGDIQNGGLIGTPAATVDQSSIIVIAQKTPNENLAIPSPTKATIGRIVFILNTGTASFTMLGKTVGASGAAGSNTNPANNALLMAMWTGSAWVTTA